MSALRDEMKVNFDSLATELTAFVASDYGIAVRYNGLSGSVGTHSIKVFKKTNDVLNDKRIRRWNPADYFHSNCTHYETTQLYIYFALYFAFYFALISTKISCRIMLNLIVKLSI